MKNSKLKLCLLALSGLGVLIWTGSSAFAAHQRQKRCTAGGVKVECPTASEAAARKAAEAFEKEAKDMGKGKSGSTYGIKVFDYLTGVGKRSSVGSKTAGASGYGATAGDSKGGRRTELWDRKAHPAKGDAVYDQWMNNWSPNFKKTLVPGADPNQGKLWYYSYCIACHGWTLQGTGPNAIELDPRPRTLTKGSYMGKKTNLELFTVIKGGGANAGLSAAMPSWGNVLQDQDIWNVIAWIRAMQDVKPPKNTNEYLTPKSDFKPIPGDVNPLNAAKSSKFADVQEMLEASLGGRGKIPGGKYVLGGGRMKPEVVEKRVKKGL